MTKEVAAVLHLAIDMQVLCTVILQINVNISIFWKNNKSTAMQGLKTIDASIFG